MFDDRYLLTKAVLRRRKTNTRRDELTEEQQEMLTDFERVGLKPKIYANDIVLFNDFGELIFSKPTRYNVGEIVAVAQSYDNAGYKISPFGGTPAGMINIYKNEPLCGNLVPEKGWKNKMFVLPELMPRVIHITDIRLERLQDISDEDCIKEGIENVPAGGGIKPYTFYDTKIHIKNDKEDGYGWYVDFDTPREAFAALIDRVSGKGTWERNPYVVVYDFELIKGIEEFEAL